MRRAAPALFGVGVAAVLLGLLTAVVFAGGDDSNVDQRADEGPVVSVVLPDDDDSKKDPDETVDNGPAPVGTSAPKRNENGAGGDDATSPEAPPNGGVATLDWSPSSGLLASGHTGGTIDLWDASERIVRHRLVLDAVEDLAWSPDGTSLAIATGTDVVIWSGPSFTEPRAVGQPGLRVAWGSDGSELVVAQSDRVYVVDTEQTTVRATYRPELDEVPDLQSLAVSGDGSMIAAATADATIYVWNTSELTLPLRLVNSKAQGTIDHLRWTPEGDLIAGAADRTLRFWNVPTQRKLLTLEDQHVPTSFAWSPDETILVSAGEVPELRFWDINEGVVAVLAAGHGAPATSVAWSGDGVLASGDTDGAILLWDLSRPGAPVGDRLS